MMNLSDFTPSTTKRFWSYVNILGPEDCWEWQRCINTGGYGKFTVRKSLNAMWYYRTNRVAYFLHYGVDPGDQLVCHTCDNRKCCNPAHLFLGSHSDNRQDMLNKGRGLTGEKATTAVLTEAQVLEIRRIDAEKSMSRTQMAAKFGVCLSQIYHIVHRKRWKHI